MEKNYSEIKDNYLKLLNNYHSIPIIISSYGYSTSRGLSSNDNRGPLTEEEQGELLVEKYEEIILSGSAGGVIESWSDNWGTRSWNTSYAVDINKSHMWDDIQTENHGYGFVSFDIKDSFHNVDGDKSEWTEDDLIIKNDKFSIFMNSDVFLY